ncbi:hypothetical protein D3C78_518140 [compost metagenome]
MFQLQSVSQRMAEQQCQGQQARQDVGRQLALAQAEEEQRHPQPQQQEPDIGLAAALPGLLERGRQQGNPRHAETHQQRQIKPPRRIMLGIVPGKTANMLVPEEESPVVRLLGVYGQCPRQADDDGDHHRHGSVDQQFTPAFLPDHPGQGDQHRQQPGQETLGHEAHAASQAQHRPGDQALPTARAVEGEP